MFFGKIYAEVFNNEKKSNKQIVRNLRFLLILTMIFPPGRMSVSNYLDHETQILLQVDIILLTTTYFVNIVCCLYD